jgi:hypothetical protein
MASSILGAAGAASPFGLLRADDAPSLPSRGIALLPGQWRPDNVFEHVAWVRTPWSEPALPDFVFLDFPEAIFCNLGLLYLGHRNPRFPAVYGDLPRVPWKKERGKLYYDRVLPNGVEFGGRLGKVDPSIVSLEIYIENGSDGELTDIKLQTCALLKHTKAFSRDTADNKFVHTPAGGWEPFNQARRAKDEQGRFRLGWRAGPAAADLPVMVTVSDRSDRLIALTWYDAAYSLICNPAHPCMHADPALADIPRGMRETIHGELIFFDGTLEQFTDWFVRRYELQKR